MDAEQSFWFRISNPTIESSNPPHVKVEVPSELPKVSLVNASLKKLKFHLAQFDSVVKKRTTPNARLMIFLVDPREAVELGHYARFRNFFASLWFSRVERRRKARIRRIFLRDTTYWSSE
ncbi:hypothetical protein Tco_0801715 [Tanacetum coccineum]|uniref:Uncharacterized protein n=1 Tax=Tanacetum coccineum TaxID=301880 RepID=A0ABQ5A0A3_9ASTR